MKTITVPRFVIINAIASENSNKLQFTLSRKLFVARVFYNLCLCLFIAVFFSGCIDEPFSEKGRINGSVYSDMFLGSNFFVSSGLYPLSPIGRNFEIESTNPYDLFIYRFDFGDPQAILKFQNVTSSNVQIVEHHQFPNLYIFFDNNAYCHANIYFPALTSKKLITGKFISNEIFENTYDDWNLLNAGSNSTQILIHTPGKPSITGKLYYLEASVDTITGRFISYDRFGIKDVVLSEGNNTINFINEEIIYNPEEYLMPISISLPPGFEGSTTVFLSSISNFRASDLRIFYSLEENGYLIPIMPINDFKIKMFTIYSFQPIFLENGFWWSYINPGEPANINYSETFSLISPADNATNITDTTTFEISDNGQAAIYEFGIYTSEMYLKLYSKWRKIKFFDFNTIFKEQIRNKECYWYVRKFPNYNNIDDFLSQPYPLDDRYDYIELSKSRTFTTAP